MLLQLELRYAAASSRPGRILMNGKVIRENAMAKTTGGWLPEHQQWHSEGLFKITAKQFTLRIESEPMMSHIDQIRLTPLKGDSNVLEIVNAEIREIKRATGRETKGRTKTKNGHGGKGWKNSGYQTPCSWQSSGPWKHDSQGCSHWLWFRGHPGYSQGPKRSITAGQMVGPSRSPPNSASDGKPGLAMAFWPGNCYHPKQFWYKGATTHTP